MRNVFSFSGSQAIKDRDKVTSLFPDKSGTNYNPFQQASLGTWAEIIVKARNGNVLELDTLQDIARMHSFVKNITALTENDTVIQYRELCGGTLLGCHSSGDVFFTRAFTEALANGTASYPLFTFVFGTRHIGSSLGGQKVTVGQGQSRYIRSSEYMRIKYPLRTDGQEYDELSELWLDEFVSKMEEFSSEYYDIAFAHANSIDEELDKNIKGDITLFSITITLMITYSCLATMSARYPILIYYFNRKYSKTTNLSNSN